MQDSGSPWPERGAATLMMAAALLLITSLVSMFTHQRLWFEQHASNNQVRALQAAELAQAGLDWATAQLNTPTALADAPSCAAAASGAVGAQLFRERYAAPSAATAESNKGFFPPAQAKAGCTLSTSGLLRCSCPMPGQLLDMATGQVGHFSVQFVRTTNDPLAIEVWATGHPGGDDTTAQARQVLKLAHSLVQPPAAAILAGGDIRSTGSLHVNRADDVVQVPALRAGGVVATGVDTVLPRAAKDSTMPSTVQGDATLAQLRAADATGERFFEVVMGRTLAGYQIDPQTTVIDARHCDHPAACGALLLRLHSQGGQQFWLGSDLALDTTTTALLGSAARPVVIATHGAISLSGGIQIHGLLLGGRLLVHEDPSAVATVVGAIAVRGDVQGSGALSVSYDRRALGMAGGMPTGTWVPVPGTWRDRFDNY